MTIRQIEKIFKAEFGSISDKFTVIEENLSNLTASKKEHIYHPGVYVFCLDDKVIKVGRHLINSRKRALEHIRDNTHNEVFEMKSLNEYTQAKILLFNLKDPNDYHWSASAFRFVFGFKSRNGCSRFHCDALVKNKHQRFFGPPPSTAYLFAM